MKEQNRTRGDRPQEERRGEIRRKERVLTFAQAQEKKDLRKGERVMSSHKKFGLLTREMQLQKGKEERRKAEEKGLYSPPSKFLGALTVGIRSSSEGYFHWPDTIKMG